MVHKSIKLIVLTNNMTSRLISSFVRTSFKF